MHPFEYTNFSACAANILPLNQSIQDGPLGYRGPVRLIPSNPSTQLSVLGCKTLCGQGADFYDWNQASSTITTWVLPVIGILLQAPMASNAFWETMFSISRWVGSPIASLAYILWNIKISGKCAMMADMAGPFAKADLNRDVNFASMRDSLYLLGTLNQYSIAPSVMTANRHITKPAEGLLRVALFSKDLRLLKRKYVTEELLHNQPVTNAPTDFIRELDRLDVQQVDSVLERAEELNAMRQKLAQQLRETRRRGVVPVFVSTLWFLFALGLSIQSAFGFLGENAVAHDLALGLLLAWLPILIMCSIVDRNPVSADDIRKKLNRLIDHVRKSLMDDTVRHLFINTIEDVAERADMRERIEQLGLHCEDMGTEPFFDKFSGQGRTRWHYGAAHGILSDIGDAYVARAGRHWLQDEAGARTYLVLGKPKGGLDWLDYRELVQVAAAFVCVGSTTFGAWLLSYYTPTVGLGCRSGGYTIFVVAATCLLLAEMSLWWYWDARKQELKQLQRRATLNTSFASKGHKLVTGWAVVKGAIERGFEKVFGAGMSAVQAVLPSRAGAGLQDWLERVNATPQDRWDCFFFKPLESANTAWLLYRTMAQTFGTDNTCDCMTSTWAESGGYIDLTQWSDSNAEYVKQYWIAGTVIGVTVMGVAMLYIVMEWCEQSWLSTADREDAAEGLQRVRKFRRLTFPVRWTFERLHGCTHSIEHTVARLFQALGILSKDYEVRPVGLRWRKDPSRRGNRMISNFAPTLPSPVSSRGRSGSDVPLVRFTSADGAARGGTPPHAFLSHGHRRGSSNDAQVSPSEVRRHLLSPEINWSPTYERRGSSNSASEHSHEGSISPSVISR